MRILEVLSQPGWQPLIWTLFHFLWQGGIVAIGVALLLHAFPIRRAPHRYAICLTAFVVMIACPFITFVAVSNGRLPEESAGNLGEDIATLGAADRRGDLEPIPLPIQAKSHDIQASYSSKTDLVNTASSESETVVLAPTPQKSISTSFYVYAVQPYCLLLWLSGVTFLAARLCFSWLHIQWLASNCSDLPTDLAARAASLSKRLGLRIAPHIRVSEKVREALVMKFYRPLILLPASWLTEMTPEMLEAVIAHELAHVRRFDLWVSLLQRIIETVLFYHPAVWWLSRRIDAEREICADELAVQTTSDRLTYATALEKLGRLRVAQLSTQIGVGIGGNRMPLLHRIANILSASTDSRRVRWWPVAFIVFAIVPVVWWGTIGAVSPAGSELHAAEAGDTRTDETAVEGGLSLEVRLVAADGKSSTRGAITFWEAVDSESVSRPEVDEKTFRIAHVWRDSATDRTWRPIHSFGNGEGATKDELGPGVYRVTATTGRTGPTMVAVGEPIQLDGSREPTVVTLAMELGPSLTIDAVDAATGKPMDDAVIRLVRSDGLPVVSWSSGFWNVRLHEGRYTFKHLAPGDYTLAAFKQAHQHGQRVYSTGQTPMRVRVAADEHQQVTVKLKDVGPSADEARRRWPWSVTGTVTDELGQPLDGAEIRVSCGVGSLMPTGATRTDEQGRYTLRFGPGMKTLDEATGILRAGLQAATIFASKPGYTEKNLCRQGGLMMADAPPPANNSWNAKPSETVLPNKPFKLDFEMALAVSIEAKLIDQRGNPISNKRISIHGKQMRPSSSVLAANETNELGLVRFEHIPANYEWWFTVDGLGRSHPITFPVFGSYQVQLQSVRHEAHDINSIRTVSVTDPRGAEVGEQIVGDDPLARPPVSEELQQQGRQYLKKMAATCRDWITQPSTKIENYEYQFRLGDEPPETISIEHDSKAGRTSRQGIHYQGTPHLLARNWENVIFRQVEVDEDAETIALRFIAQDSGKIAAGNGITGRFHGFFSAPLSEGLIVLDQRTCRPLKTEWETFSNYVEITDGRFAPRRIQIHRSGSKWDWRFHVYQPGLWMLKEARLAADADPILTVDRVTINGKLAVPVAAANDLSWGEPARGVKIRLHAPKTQWNFGETPTLLCDFLNVDNQRIDQLVLLNEYWQIEVDGTRFLAERPDPTGRNSFPEFGRGTEHRDIPVPGFEEFTSADGPPVLSPGKHTVRVHFLQNENQKDKGRYPDIHLISNPLEIEVLEEAQTATPIDDPDKLAASKKPAEDDRSDDVEERGILPIIEREIHDPRSAAGKPSLIDFDSGRVVVWPTDRLGKFDPERGYTDAIKKYLSESGFDAIARSGKTETETKGLVGFGMSVLIPVRDTYWHMDPPQIQEQLGRDIGGPGLLLLGIATRPEEQPIRWRHPLLDHQGTRASTYLFETREGSPVMVQIASVTESSTTLRYKIIGTRQESRVKAGQETSGAGAAARKVVEQWLTLIEEKKMYEAAQLMHSGRNENADDGLSMTVALEAVAEGRISPAIVYAHPHRALVTTNALGAGRYAGRSFIFHLANNLNRQRGWKIYEVSMVSPTDVEAQLEAFHTKPVNQKVDSMGFGPIIERSPGITDSYFEALDLDANRVIRVPNDFDTNRDVTQDPLKWLVVRGVDLGAAPNRRGDMELRSVFMPRVRRVGNEAWDEFDTAKVRKMLPARQPGMPPSTLLHADDDSFPITHIFETSTEPTGTSQQGILQVVAVDQEKQTVTLRYKLVAKLKNANPDTDVVEQSTEEQPATPPRRVGVYDSRSIAFAYWTPEKRSEYVDGLQKQQKAATARGDDDEAKRLSDKIWAHRILLSMQVFSTAPVDNILDTIKGSLAQVKKRADIDLLASKWDRTSLSRYKEAEQVDVTLLLLAELDIEEKPLRYVWEMKRLPPEPLDRIEKDMRDKGHWVDDATIKAIVADKERWNANVE